MKFKVTAALFSVAFAATAMAAKTTTVMMAPKSSSVIAPNATSVASASSTSVVVPSASSMVMPTSGASLSTTIKAASGAKSKITPSYVAENYVGARAVNIGNYDDFTSQQHVGLAYDLGNDRKVQYRQYFHYNMTDRKVTDEWAIGDHVFQYTDATALKIADADMLFYARVYMPGAEWTREVGKYELRLFEGVTQELGAKTTIDYGLNTRFYSYSGDNDGQKGLRVLPAIQVAYQVNNSFSPYIGMYTDHNWSHTGSGPALYLGNAGVSRNPANYAEALYTDIGANVAVNKNVKLNIYLENEKPTSSNRDNVKYDLFEDANNYYGLDLSVSM